ncbi:RNA-binding domain-containing protein [Nocardia asteroides]|uniref:RNA-binding domain-containing protein n=1 Tax=Nocardia asteroides TaxID=1824 RepID=UPI001E3EA7B7|nr:RNA-binding domain-containing protein [Nocardia asteroides]UGT64534.1 putative DNA binding domain-containing protein [Nocardia asteroides]
MAPDELADLLDRLIAGRESEVVEFKTARDQFDTNKTGKYVSALSNEANLRGVDAGWLVFGVADDGQIVGTRHLSSLGQQQALKREIQQSTGHRLSLRQIHQLDRDGRMVVLLEIPAAPRSIPIPWKGHCWARAGESLEPLSDTKLDAIRAQSAETDWTAGVVPEATLGDLDPVALARARQGFAERRDARIPAREVESWDDTTFLDRAKLTRNGRITRACLLLLGADRARHLLSPHPAQLTWSLVGPEQAYEHFHLPFLLTATALSKRIRNVQIRLLPPDELIYREISKYDERSILEAFYNCIAHQDYRRNSRIIVVERVDRLEFISVGEFFDGAPDEYVLHGRMPRSYRNPFLVEAMTQLNLIDQMGYGIHRMVQDQVRRFLPLPDYDLADPGEVKLSIPGAVIDEGYSRLLMVRTDLRLDDILALDRVQKNLPIPDEAAKRLRKQKLIEGRRPHLHVSAAVATATDAKADYIRTRALDNEHYERLLTEYLAQFGEATRTEIDAFLLGKFSDALDPEEKYRKVSTLLTRLRRAGRIENAGSRRDSRWRLVT